MARKLEIIEQPSFQKTIYETKEISAMTRGFWKSIARKNH